MTNDERLHLIAWLESSGLRIEIAFDGIACGCGTVVNSFEPLLVVPGSSQVCTLECTNCLRNRMLDELERFRAC